MSKGELRMFQLLDAAETILVRDGADALTLREVAKEAGITLGNLQYYFPTRAKLLEAIFERYATEFRAERAAVIDGVDDSREMLIGVVDYWLKTELRHEQGLFWHLWAISAHDDSARETMETIYGRLVKFLAFHLRRIHRGMTTTQAARRGATIVALIEGSGLFVGYRRHPTGALVGLQEEIRATVIELIDRAPTRTSGAKNTAKSNARRTRTAGTGAASRSKTGGAGRRPASRKAK